MGGRAKTTGPPDYVGVGTLDAGTAWWHDMLLRHPQVERRRRRERELHFFDRFCAREMTDADVAAYHRQLARKPGRLAGEWTARYVYDAWTPPLLRRAAPHARLLVMLSDPIERYRRRLARELQAAKSDDPEIYMADAAGRGRYATQLRALRAFFEDEQILVLQYERCRADPFGEYARTLRFLGLDDGFCPRALRRQHARGFGPRAPVRILHSLGVPTGRASQPEPARLWPDIEQSLHDELDPEVSALAAELPELDLGLWPNFGHLAAPAAR